MLDSVEFDCGHPPCYSARKSKSLNLGFFVIIMLMTRISETKLILLIQLGCSIIVESASKDICTFPSLVNNPNSDQFEQVKKLSAEYVSQSLVQPKLYTSINYRGDVYNVYRLEILKSTSVQKGRAVSIEDIVSNSDFGPAKQILKGLIDLCSMPTLDTKSKKILYTDGASRGNPGHSACGYVIIDGYGEVVAEGGQYLGITTSSLAEYHALKLGLDAAHGLGIDYLECRSDNSMIVNQMNDFYDVQNRDLWPVHERIVDIVKKFKDVKFVHVNREFNTIADGIANKVLDDYLISL